MFYKIEYNKENKTLICLFFDTNFDSIKELEFEWSIYFDNEKNVIGLKIKNFDDYILSLDGENLMKNNFQDLFPFPLKCKLSNEFILFGLLEFLKSIK